MLSQYNFLRLAETWGRLAREPEASKRFLEWAKSFRWRSLRRRASEVPKSNVPPRRA